MRTHALLVAATAAAFVTPSFAQMGRETLSFPTETAATNNGQLGVAYLNGEIFVSSRGAAGTTIAPHTVWVFDRSGSLLRSFSQPASTNSSVWGLRDGATDGVSLMFGHEGGIEVFDSNGNPVTTIIAAAGPQTVTLPIVSAGSVSTHRALAYDPSGNGGLGSFFIADFGSPVEEISLNGTVLHSYPLNGWSAYGMALDPVNGTMWFNSAPNAGPLAEYTIDRTTNTMTPTGVTIDRNQPTSSQGGLALVPGGLDGRNCGFDLIGLDQGTPDTVTGYRLHLWDGYAFTNERQLLAGVDGANFSADGVVVGQGASTVEFDLSGSAGTPYFVFVDIFNDPPRAIGSVGPFKSPWEFTFPRPSAVYVGGFSSGTPVSFPAAALTAAPHGTTVTWQALFLDTNVPVGTACGLIVPLVATNLTSHEVSATLLTENFDTLANGANYPTGWVDGGGQRQWLVDDLGTTSSGTGPTGAVSGTKYIYAETSSPATSGDNFILNSAVYSATTYPATAVQFQLSRIGATIGTLEVRLDDGSGTFSTLLGSYTGPEPNGVEWVLESLTLPSPLPANYQIQLRYTCGTSFTGDLAIDDFSLL